jgi:protein-S-isoprenylcysteine O-methyltransferase
MIAVSIPYLFLERPLWTVLLVGCYVAFNALGFWAQARERQWTKGDVRDQGSRIAIYFFTFFGIGLAFAGPFLVPAARIELPPDPVFWAAMLIFWTGAVFYGSSVLTLGASFRTSVQLVEGQRLVTKGLYRFIRHPAYTGGILMFAGLGLAMGNWFSAAGASLSMFAGYLIRIRVEEKALTERFGEEFAAHRRRTWAVIPPIW